ncbi:uncharacterized protein PGTG_02166 [Puccinia graminis f. sp. tritici CRL 75-36-700-3]|uniref:Tyr recombinase domain-containing protein n=1 Tax=Puccinia graminis f. sp. tritici (strain CRL 75-36-700-3 / race SCCL) TaxID=418459 RepID=E3JXD0_PUCGT|nr:uncharacterized protein PGTG_02166 [Puccinia graminis f. sp. tritici CRL 75-36-700-3]EFP76705.2 hypothetical protein PGTG_02166 [Puccinia graminis f. sp. tritici CRL 75-36-700-3]
MDLSKIKDFLKFGSTKKQPNALDIHFLGGYKWNTLLSYNSAVRKFGKFKEATGQREYSLPVSAPELYEFCYWAGRNATTTSPQDVASKTLTKYLFGIQAWHLYHSTVYPPEAKAKITVLLRSSAHTDAQSPKRPRKAPVMLKHLVSLTETLLPGGPYQKAVLDLAITAFWGMARLSELTSEREEGTLRWSATLFTSDVKFYQTPLGIAAALEIRGAKTCAPGDSQTIHLQGLNHMLCPVAAVKRRIAKAGPNNVPLFGFNTPTGRVNLVKTKVVRTLGQVWSEHGYQGITGHSFRVGGTSLRFAIGVPVEEICALGRWTSCWNSSSIDRDSTLKRARTQQTESAAVIDYSLSANATETENYTRSNRSSLLNRLSSPIAVALPSKNVLSETIDKPDTTNIYNNQNTKLYLEANKGKNK